MDHDNLIQELSGEQLNQWNPIIKKMEQVFKDIGFKKVLIQNNVFFKYDMYYCKITPLLFPNGKTYFVLEWADSLQEAKTGLTEDGNLYPSDYPIDNLLKMLKNDLIKQIQR